MKKRNGITEKTQSMNNFTEKAGNCNKSYCGFVAVVGEPNFGKSTLINAIVGEKVSIVSPKCQTTRRQVRGIVQFSDEADGCDRQIVFIDTPGFFSAKTALEKALVSNFKYAYRDADIILILIDGTSRHLANTFAFIEKIKDRKNQKVVVAINKVDKARKESLLEIADKLSAYDFIEQIFMVSALTSDGIPDVVDYLKSNILEGPWMYQDSQKTDMNMAFRLSEITREKVYQTLDKELPYNIYIETESFKEAEKKARIYQAIVVMKDSQKGIVLGHKGERIKHIKDMAIADMKLLLNKKVELKLFVKVKENWTEKKAHLQNAGIIDY